MNVAFPRLADTALHGLTGDIVRAILPHSEADPAALLVQALVFFGNCIGRTTHFVAEDDNHYGNLFTVLVGDTSKARKGTSLGRIRRIFREVDEKWASTRLVNGLSSGEGLISAVRDAAVSVVDHIPILDGGASDKRLLVLESEFAAVLRVMARDGNTLSSTIREAWDTGTLNVMTKKNPLQASDAHKSIIGHITREELRKRLTETDRANGFANRFLWVAVRRSKLLPEGGKLDEDTCKGFARRLREAVEHARTVGEMKRNEEAGALWAKIYEQLSNGPSGLVGALTSRAEAQIMRLAILYALLDCSATIEPPHLKAAYALWQYCEASAQYIFGSLTGNSLADAILSALKMVDPNGLTLTEINKHFSGHKKSEEFLISLSELMRRGLVTFSDEDTGGRPVRRWFAVVKEADNAEKAEKATDIQQQASFSASSASSESSNGSQQQRERWLQTYQQDLIQLSAARGIDGPQA